MALIIQDEQVERMVADLAARAGITPEEAVARAVRTQWREVPVTPAGEDADLGLRGFFARVSEGLARQPVADNRSPDDILYDKNGLPHGW